MAAPVCDYCGEGIQQDETYLRVSCGRGCEDEPFHPTCVTKYLKGKPQPKDMMDGGWQCPIGRGSSYKRAPCKGAVDFVEEVQPDVTVRDNTSPAPGSPNNQRRAAGGGGGQHQAFVLPAARIFVPEAKADPLGRKLPAAAAAAAAALPLGKAAKKNARRAQRREEQRLGNGGAGSDDGRSGDDGSGGGTPPLADRDPRLQGLGGARPASAGGKGSPTGTPPSPQQPARVGPAVHGSTALMEDDPRLGFLGAELDDDGFGVAVPASGAECVEPAAAPAAGLPFFTGDEEEEDPYNQEIAPGARPPPVRPRVQVDATWGRAGALGSAAEGMVEPPPAGGGSKGGRAARRKGAHSTDSDGSGSSPPTGSGARGGRGGRHGPSPLGRGAGRSPVPAALGAGRGRGAAGAAGPKSNLLSAAAWAGVAARTKPADGAAALAQPKNRFQVLSTSVTVQEVVQQPAEGVQQEEGVQALLLVAQEQEDSGGQQGADGIPQQGGSQAPAAGGPQVQAPQTAVVAAAPPAVLEELTPDLRAALANHQDPKTSDILVKHFAELAAHHPASPAVAATAAATPPTPGFPQQPQPQPQQPSQMPAPAAPAPPAAHLAPPHPAAAMRMGPPPPPGYGGPALVNLLILQQQQSPTPLLPLPLAPNALAHLPSFPGAGGPPLNMAFPHAMPPPPWPPGNMGGSAPPPPGGPPFGAYPAGTAPVVGAPPGLGVPPHQVAPPFVSQGMRPLVPLTSRPVVLHHVSGPLVPLPPPAQLPGPTTQAMPLVQQPGVPLVPPMRPLLAPPGFPTLPPGMGPLVGPGALAAQQQPAAQPAPEPPTAKTAPHRAAGRGTPPRIYIPPHLRSQHQAAQATESAKTQQLAAAAVQVKVAPAHPPPANVTVLAPPPGFGPPPPGFAARPPGFEAQGPAGGVPPPNGPTPPTPLVIGGMVGVMLARQRSA